MDKTGYHNAKILNKDEEKEVKIDKKTGCCTNQANCPWSTMV